MTVVVVLTVASIAVMLGTFLWTNWLMRRDLRLTRKARQKKQRLHDLEMQRLNEEFCDRMDRMLDSHFAAYPLKRYAQRPR